MEVIFKYPDQKFVGIATRKANGELCHQGYMLVDRIPQTGANISGWQVSELLTDEELLKERSRCALNPIEAVAVLGRYPS